MPGLLGVPGVPIHETPHTDTHTHITPESSEQYSIIYSVVL